MCWVLMLIPVGASAISWIAPRGAPGVAVSVVAWALVYYPEDPGPTAEALTLGFTVGLAGSALVVELLVGSLRRDRLRRQAPKPDDTPHEVR